MDYIKSKLSEDLAKKILGNNHNARKYLSMLYKQKETLDFKFKKISKGKNKGSIVLDIGNKNLLKVIVDTWDYEISKDIIRDIFKETKKYQDGTEANSAMEILIKEWRALNLRDIGWPFSQGAFDAFVQRINSESGTGLVKDEKVKIAAVKYRRIKEINTVRNDFIETLIFEKNKNIMPTLSHRKGADFFIDGVSFDQKVAKSPTNEFKNKFGENWRIKAIENPKLVAEYLYKYQDEGRFGADPRLFVVYIDEDISIQRIKQTINEVDLNKPIEVNFTYKHKNIGEKSYKAPCFVILLYNS